MNTPIKSLMAKKLICARAEVPVPEAARLMHEKRIRHLPITNFRNEIVGILSQRDLNDAGLGMENIPVGSIMSAPVVSIDQNVALRAAIFQMLEKKISCLLVSDDYDEAIGIVTTDDLLWHLATLLPEEPSGDFKTKAFMTVGEIARQLGMAGI